MDERCKVIQVKVDECNVQLNDIKKQMATAKGTRLNSLKQKALMVLRRRKMYETQLNNVMNQQFNVDQMAFAAESIQTTVNTVQAMKVGVQAQQEFMKGFNFGQMEDMMDDMKDLMADMEEINEVMNRDFGVEFDEAALMGELDELEEELAIESLNEGLGIPSYLPA